MGGRGVRANEFQSKIHHRDPSGDPYRSDSPWMKGKEEEMYFKRGRPQGGGIHGEEKVKMPGLAYLFGVH